jgi:hypothetical protein
VEVPDDVLHVQEVVLYAPPIRMVSNGSQSKSNYEFQISSTRNT